MNTTTTPVNRGALFRNDRKKETSHPDHSGDITIQCPHCGEVTFYNLGAWIKERANGAGRFFSLSLKAKESVQAKPTRPGDLEDIPF